MRFGLFSMSEYINLITLSALCVTLFLGGWHGPGWDGPSWPGRSGSSLKLVAAALRLHLDANDAAAPALRPAHALRLEGPAPGRDDQRRRDRRPGGVAVSPQPLDTLKGFAVTFRQIFRKPITQQYPEYKRPVYPRFRGRHRLCTRTRTGSRSASAARSARPPARQTASASSPPRTRADNRVSAGERYARIYEINMSRCIFCGYCELACPFDAITLGNEFEISEYSRDDLDLHEGHAARRADQARPGRRPRRTTTRRARRTRSARSDGQLPGLGRLVPRRGRLPGERRSPSSASRTRSTRRSR